ncbi:uncharacterized protein LOC133205710 isoform X2 [Saccostrea echinata]|uniref:uncharacterized protein LOC133205710 isoform X2 n=1 Tax=Saccostrea echinata TaxID=191078 RepID=UPI002A83BE20|nr:uncharacterized protein LOC133205710 isoform X2 [Saccostrea echinata]
MTGANLFPRVSFSSLLNSQASRINVTEIMEVNSLFIALIFPVIAVAQVTNTVYLDNSAGNECGKSTKLTSGSQIRLSTNGKTEDGYCGFLIHRISDPNTKCPFPGMCARIDNSKMTSCQSKVAFTGKYFDKTPDSTQELSCYIKPKGAQFCTQAPAMRIEVTETPDYAMKEAHDYGFNITVYSQCFDNREAVIVEYVEDDYKAPDLEAAWRKNYILGIVVACCLCSIFLILLIILKFYYRNKPYAGIKEDR